MCETGTIDSVDTCGNGVRQHLLGWELGAHDVARRARPAHAEWVPGAGRLERDLVLASQHEHLVAGLGVGGAAKRGEEVVCVLRRS